MPVESEGLAALTKALTSTDIATSVRVRIGRRLMHDSGGLNSGVLKYRRPISFLGRVKRRLEALD